MFKANNMRMLLVLSMVLFVLCSSVNMVPARSFLEDIKRYSKRQGELVYCDDFPCPGNNFRCNLSPIIYGCPRGMYYCVL